jgi:hypothetical protein
MKNDSCNQRGLMMALIALKHFAVTNFTVGSISTKRTFKSGWPAQFKEFIAALTFGAELLHETIKTHAFLKLYFLLGHGTPHYFSGCYLAHELYNHG